MLFGGARTGAGGPGSFGGLRRPRSLSPFRARRPAWVRPRACDRLNDGPSGGPVGWCLGDPDAGRGGRRTGCLAVGLWPAGRQADGHGRRLTGRAGCSRAGPRRSIPGRVRTCLSGSVEDKTTDSAAGTRHESGTRQRFVRGGVSRPRFAGVWPVLSGWVHGFELARLCQGRVWECSCSGGASRPPALR